uniref:Paired amphipathic helix protein Sin3-like 3 isoform X2 n=1 Tax=Rhizophora mucronata TaxID=61149 RepID=A0A2P2IQU3_RHIMU
MHPSVPNCVLFELVLASSLKFFGTNDSGSVPQVNLTSVEPRYFF